MIVVLSEKPSVAKELAKVMGADKREDGYISGNGYLFTWAYGHLIQLAFPEAYGFTGWSKDNLPIIPDKFKLVSRQVKDGKKGYKDEPGAKKQLKVIAACFAKADIIIAATDSGREGELIFRYIYEFLKCSKSVKRLWINSYTDKSIREGFSLLKDGSQYNNLFESARTRSEADWLVGINATQALSLSVGNGVYSIGRVQTPTLVIICQRHLDNINFKPEVYFQLELDHIKNDIGFTVTSSKRWSNKAEVEELFQQVNKIGVSLVTKVDVKERKELTPLLYDLTTLQQDANKRLGFSAEKSLAIAQKLYEGKFITYPRTGSRYIGDDVFEHVPALIELLVQYPEFSIAASDLIELPALSKRSVNGSKVTDHHALLPTEVIPRNLEGESKSIYELILARTLEAFHEDCLKEITTVELQCKEIFEAKGVVTKYSGWRSVVQTDEITETSERVVILPQLDQGEKLDIIEVRNVAKQTRPKPLHTEASLLSMMETCGKEIEDEEARIAMKDVGLGTPATRASIIEALLTRNYIVRKKKSIVPTEKGYSVYELVSSKAIGKPEMTGEWESLLGKIESGHIQSKEVMVGIKNYTKTITEELLEAGGSVNKSVVLQSSVDSLKCPKCKLSPIRSVKNPKLDAMACADRECGFIIFRMVARKKLSDRVMRLLIEKGETDVIKGFISRKDKAFDARLRLDGDFKVVFKS